MIRVPLLVDVDAQQKKFVEIHEESLPENVDQVISMLSKEKVSIEYWLELSVSSISLVIYTYSLCIIGLASSKSSARSSVKL